MRRHLSLVAKTQYCALMSWGGWYLVTVSLILPFQPARSAGDWARMSFDLLCNVTCVTAAESAVMRIISADTIEADTILSIGYTQYRIRCDTDSIIVRSLI